MARSRQRSDRDALAVPSGELLFGLHAVSAALRRDPARLQRLWYDPARDDARMRQLLAEVAAAGVPTEELSRRELDALVGGQAHQGVVARHRGARALDEAGLAVLLDGLEEPPFLLLLDGVQDPHNLGACLRTADAAGVHAVVVPRDRACALTPVVSKVASGAAETVPFVQVTNLARTMRLLQERGIWLVGAAGEADSDLYQADLHGPLGLVMGAEGTGLRRLTREHCDLLISIPMVGSVESLNVSVATAICLYEAVRQRRPL